MTMQINIFKIMKLILPLLASIVVSWGAFDEQNFIVDETLDNLKNGCIGVLESNEEYLNEKIIQRFSSKESIKNTQ